MLLRALSGPGLIPAHTGKTRACRAEPTSTRAHPRSRGENPPPLEVPKYAMGSSPLMRGKPGRVHGVTERLGLIPTHAGKTWSATERSPSRTAHPRSRGEKRESTTQKVPRAGSSPLTRGELACDTQGVDVVGLIPTHAGKTAPSQYKTCARRAHPRSRGENIASSFAFAWSLGSSPLTRGKLEFDGLQPAAVGLIPAHAEKTHWESPPARPRRAHPRSRRENANSISEPVLPNGSSPLTRGKHRGGAVKTVGEGLIPAHAGKTRTARTPRRPGRAHPRSCGENTRKMGLAAMVAGSSPLMRGKPRLRRPHRRQDGLIPAHAGKTARAAFPAAISPAHPCSRGENTS